MTNGQFPIAVNLKQATYVSELHTSSLTELCDRRICSFRLDEELTKAHLFTSEKRLHAAAGCVARTSCKRKTNEWSPQLWAHTPKELAELD
jgi:hypothetical protein